MEAGKEILDEIVETYKEFKRISADLESVVEPMKGKNRRLDFLLPKDIVDEIEEIFCYRVIAGKRVKMQYLATVVRDAFLRGMILMLKERDLLKELEAKGLLEVE